MSGLSRARFQRLAELSLVRGMAEPDLVLVAETGRWQSYAPGTTVMREGEEGDELLLVTAGRFAVVVGQNGGRAALAEVRAGEVLGEAVLFRRVVRRSADVVALEESEAIAFSNGELEALARVGNGLPRAIEDLVLETLARRILASRDLVARMLRGEEPPPSGGGLFARLKGLFGG